MMLRTCAALSLLAVAGAVGCSPAVEAKFDEVRVTRPDIAVPPAAGLSSVTFYFNFDSTQVGASQNLEAQSSLVAINLNALSFTAKTGVSDLSFIQSLHAAAFVPLKTTDPNKSMETVRQVEIADYVRRDHGPIGPTFAVPLPEPVDMLPLLKPSSTELRRIYVVVALGGQLPNQLWTADAAMTISVEMRQ